MEPVASTSAAVKGEIRMDLKEFKSSVQQIQNSSALHDLILFLGRDEVQIATNKTLLAAFSDIFKTMLFNTNFPPTPAKRARTDQTCAASDIIREDGVREMRFPDDDPRVFNMFVKFISGEVVEIGLEDIPEMLLFANKYNVIGLETSCLRIAKEFIKKDNVLKIYDSAREARCKELAKLCLPIICSKAAELFRTEQFTKLSRESVRKILDRDDLSINEIEIFEALQRWAKREHYRDGYAEQDVFDLKCVLKNLKYCLRPTEISHADLVELVVPTELFSAAERLQIYEFPYASFTMTGFTTTKRKGASRPFKLISVKQEFQPVRICNMYQEASNVHADHVINYCRFKLSRVADVTDIEFNGSCQENIGSYDIDLALTEVGSGDQVWESSRRLAFSSITQNLWIRLRSGEVVLKGETWYLLTFDIKGPPPFYQEYFVGKTHMEHYFGGPEPSLTVECDAMQRLPCEGHAGWSQLHSLTFNFPM